MSGLNIPVSKTLLAPSSLDDAKPLVGFDLGDELFHVVLFPENDGSIGIFKDGENFCARIMLDALVEFWRQARASHVQGNA
jgi:hypothetical protein